MSERIPYSEIGFSEREGQRTYDQVADQHDFDFMGLVESKLVSQGNCSLLDIGCGNSSFGREIACAYPSAEIYTVDAYSDTDRGYTARASDPPNLHFVQADGSSIPFANACFDIIVTTWGPARYGSTYPREGHSYITEIGRTLKPDGTAFSRPEGKIFTFPLQTIIEHPKFPEFLKAKATDFKTLEDAGFHLFFNDDPNRVKIYGSEYS